nr:mediator of RNA polymerase II transcription subunit 15A-like [Tanacetum cinerariifolium]
MDGQKEAVDDDVELSEDESNHSYSIIHECAVSKPTVSKANKPQVHLEKLMSSDERNQENEDLSTMTKSMFSISLRSLSQPMSLKEIAKTWDVCACVISDHAQQSEVGTFSSKYGTWENYLSIA